MKSKRTITPRKFGRPGVIFEEEDVVQLLRAAVEKDGSQAAWARRHNIERANVNAMLCGKKRGAVATSKSKFQNLEVCFFEGETILGHNDMIKRQFRAAIPISNDLATAAWVAYTWRGLPMMKIKTVPAWVFLRNGAFSCADEENGPIPKSRKKTPAAQKTLTA